MVKSFDAWLHWERMNNISLENGNTDIIIIWYLAICVDGTVCSMEILLPKTRLHFCGDGSEKSEEELLN